MNDKPSFFYPLYLNAHKSEGIKGTNIILALKKSAYMRITLSNRTEHNRPVRDALIARDGYLAFKGFGFFNDYGFHKIAVSINFSSSSFRLIASLSFLLTRESFFFSMITSINFMPVRNANRNLCCPSNK